jgi:hypothetical protein
MGTKDHLKPYSHDTAKSLIKLECYMTIVELKLCEGNGEVPCQVLGTSLMDGGGGCL